MVANIFVALIAYLIGSISSSVIISKKLAGFDVREKGSGNAGTTNVLRTVGKKAALITLVCDILKGVVAIGIALIVGLIFKSTSTAALVQIAGLFVVIGHTFPVFFKFRGGKGVATSLGVLLMTNWKVGLICLVFAIALMALTKMVSLGSISAAVLFAVLALFIDKGYIVEGNYVIFAVCLAALVIFNHRSNLKRISEGTENKLDLEKLFKREPKVEKEEPKEVKEESKEEKVEEKEEEKEKSAEEKAEEEKTEEVNEEESSEETAEEETIEENNTEESVEETVEDNNEEESEETTEVVEDDSGDEGSEEESSEEDYEEENDDNENIEETTEEETTEEEATEEEAVEEEETPEDMEKSEVERIDDVVVKAVGNNGIIQGETSEEFEENVEKYDETAEDYDDEDEEEGGFFDSKKKHRRIRRRFTTKEDKRDIERMVREAEERRKKNNED